MTDVPPLRVPTSQQADAAVEAAFEAAKASGWASEQRSPLWHAGVEAVLAYAEQLGEVPRAVGYCHLVVDLAPEDGDWPADTWQAVRLAAERTLETPSKPHHRARAKGLLRRVAAMENPLRAAREQAQVAIARQLQALSRQALDGPGSDERLYRIQAQQQWLSRIAEALRFVPLEGRADEAAVGDALARTLAWVEARRWEDPASESATLELLMGLRAPGQSPGSLEPLTRALAAIRHGQGAQHRAARLELLAMVQDLRLDVMDAEGRAALPGLMDSVAHLARHLGEVPDDLLNGLLLRLRMRIEGLGVSAFEPLIEEAVRLQGTLEAHRLEARALLSALDREDWDADELRQERNRYQRRVREITWLLDALAGLRLRGVPGHFTPRLLQLLGRLEGMVEETGLAPGEFDARVRLIALQLETPRLAHDPVWLAGQELQLQLADQRRHTAERVRGLALERHLEPAARRAEQDRLRRQLDDLDRLGQALGSMPLDALSADRRADALQALQALTQGARRLAIADDREAWRQALETLVRIC